LSEIAAVIFDLDGTLVDSEPLHYAVLNRVLQREGHFLAEEQYNQFIGTTLRNTISTLVKMFGLPRTTDEYEMAYKDALLVALKEPIEPNPGAYQLLSQLHSYDKKLAVASSSPRVVVEASLKALGLAQFFETIVAGDEVKHSKPDPEIFLRAAEGLGVVPSACLVIEDAPAGVAGAIAAGMRVAALHSPLITDQAFSAEVLIVERLDDIALKTLCLPVIES
jgi:HAD superfamily hydrolase (TIGR01509 family)